MMIMIMMKIENQNSSLSTATEIIVLKPNMHPEQRLLARNMRLTLAILTNLSIFMYMIKKISHRSQ